MNWQDLLDSQGYFEQPVTLPPALLDCVRLRNWREVDSCVQGLVQPGGCLFEALRPYTNFTEIEHILSIRPAIDLPPDEFDEDGIWHDDGSRVLAFSLSLTLQPERIEGGRLGFRRRESPETLTALVPTPAYGTMIVFATGSRGYEHRIHRVLRGERVIIAGWCT